MEVAKKINRQKGNEKREDEGDHCLPGNPDVANGYDQGGKMNDLPSDLNASEHADLPGVRSRWLENGFPKSLPTSLYEREE